ncbi:MAG: hypothetical protein ACRDD1_10855, partial [Planctomycetia bacterium]
MPPIVVFSIKARTKMQQRTAGERVQNPTAADGRFDEVSRKIGKIFEGASIVVVQDLYSGFRTEPGEFILLVETTTDGVGDGLSVVKIASAEKLRTELEGWTSCRPPGLRHDIVLMDLEPGYADSRKSELAALMYADAEQLIGVDQTVTLEAAAIDAVLYGAPTVESVADVLFQIYTRLGLLLYSHGWNDDPGLPEPGLPPVAEPAPSTKPPYPYERLDRRLEENLKLWRTVDTTAFRMRASATTETVNEPLRYLFRDPVDMRSYIFNQRNPERFGPA